MADRNKCSNNAIVGKENTKLIPNTTAMKYKKNNHQKKDSFSNIFLLVCIIGISMAILLEIINMTARYQRIDSNCLVKPKFWTPSNSPGQIKHVLSVLKTIGVEKSTNKTPWDLLWSSDLPHPVKELLPHQKLNNIPGSFSITSKVSLVILKSTYIPKAFKLPRSKNNFFEYAKKNNRTLFLEKSNTHRGISLKNVSEIDVSSGKKFVQEFIEKPFLVNGHKFDMGVYVAITSVDPLRAYWYKGDVLLRYCKFKYYPFDPNVSEKYVFGQNYYLPTWEVPSLAELFTSLGHGMKDSFDIYVRSKSINPSVIWDEVQKAIADILVKQAPHMVTSTKKYPSQDNFFQMIRFDLIVNEDLKVYLLEANLSPNLDSTHFKQNAQLYEQVLYNLFSLTGISHKPTRNRDDVKNMVSAPKNIAVFGEQCATVCNDSCEVLPLCKLCKPCLDHKLGKSLLKAHTEFLHRGDFRRLVPLPMKPEKNVPEPPSKDATSFNKQQHLWYQEKCNQDITWCTQTC